MGLFDAVLYAEEPENQSPDANLNIAGLSKMKVSFGCGFFS